MKNISDPLLRDDLAKCFAGNPDERFKTAKEMAENLRSLEARRAALQARKIFRRRIFAVAACLAIAAFIGFKIISANRAAREARLRAYFLWWLPPWALASWSGVPRRNR